jgi:hypothetical protein
LRCFIDHLPWVRKSWEGGRERERLESAQCPTGRVSEIQAWYGRGTGDMTGIADRVR